MVIIAALSIEIAPLLNALKAEKVKAYSNKRGLYRTGEMDFLITGVGPVMAQRTLETYLDEHAPDLILNIGTAGMLLENMELGTIHHIEKTLTENENAISLHMLTDDPGETCLSVRRSIEHSGHRDNAQKKHMARLADMECYALASVAKDRGIPMSAIKITSDFADCETAEMFKEQVEQNAIKLKNELIKIIKS